MKYLVSTRGESQWVKNVRADPNVRLGDTKYIAREIPVEQRAPILAAYKPKAGKVVEGYWKICPTTPTIRSSRSHRRLLTLATTRYLKCECLYDWAFQAASPCGVAVPASG